MIDEQLLSLKEIHKLLRLSAPTVRNMWRNGDFPQPILTGYQKKQFRRSEVEAWMRRKSERQSAA